MKHSSRNYRGSMLLFLAAFIWGVAFVAQSVGMDYMGPFTFNGVRSLIGGTVLLPLIAFRSRRQAAGDGNGGQETGKDGVKRENAGPERRNAGPTGAENGDGIRTPEQKKAQRRVTLTGGICCGLALCSASMLQQIGIQYTSVGKAGFITTLYIIIVPIMGLFFRKKVRRIVWGGAFLAAAGMYLLCVGGSFRLNKGDMLVFVCAILFSIHILVVDYFSPKADGVKLSCIQFYVSGILCMAGAFLWETPSLSALSAGIIPVLYAGVMSCGVAYTLQIVGQKDMDPTVASLILSMESVISVLAGWVLLGQALSLKELSGCALVFAAVILVQLPEKKKQRT